MEHRVKKDRERDDLIAIFEDNFKNGHVIYLDDNAIDLLTDAYSDHKMYDNVLEIIEISLEHFPLRTDLYLAKAKILLKLNKYDQSIKTLDTAQSLSSCDKIHILKAKAYAKKGDFTQAFQEIELYSTRKEEDIDLYLCQSYIYEKMKAYQEMFNTLKKALLIDGKNKEALERFQFATDKSKSFDEAIQFCKCLIDQQPYNHLAWYNLGISLSSIGEYDESIKALEYSFLVEPTFETGYTECAEVCSHIENYHKAKDVYIDFISTFGEDVEVQILLAECLVKTKSYDEALDVLYRAVKNDPYSDEIYYLLGEAYAGLEQWYNALNCYFKAIKIEEDVEYYYFAIAKAYLQVEEYNKATYNFQMAISFGPEDTRYWKEFAILMIKLGLYREALHILEEAEDFSYGTDLVYCKSVAYLFLKEKNRAISLLEEALEEDYDAHKIIFEIDPELEIDIDVKSIIKYYSLDC